MFSSKGIVFNASLNYFLPIDKKEIFEKRNALSYIYHFMNYKLNCLVVISICLASKPQLLQEINECVVSGGYIKIICEIRYIIQLDLWFNFIYNCKPSLNW